MDQNPKTKRGTKKLGPKEDIIDKNMNLFFHMQLILMNIDRIGWQVKINLKFICYKSSKTRYLLSNSDKG